jgi:hypothetical protein
MSFMEAVVGRKPTEFRLDADHRENRVSMPINIERPCCTGSHLECSSRYMPAGPREFAAPMAAEATTLYVTVTSTSAKQRRQAATAE